MLWYIHSSSQMYLLIKTGFSGEWWGPWVSCCLAYHIWHMGVSPWITCHIRDLCMTFTFGLDIKIIFSPWIFVWARSCLLFDLGIPNLAHGCITMNNMLNVYIHDLDLWPICGGWGTLSEYYSWFLSCLKLNFLHPVMLCVKFS